MLKSQGHEDLRTARRCSTLEDFKLEPGDMVSLYAVARRTRAPRAKTDMFFIEAQPFETRILAVAAGRRRRRRRRRRGGPEPDLQAPERNHRRHLEPDQGHARTKAEPPRTPSSSPSAAKLRDQAQSLADRMKARAACGREREFKTLRQGHGEGRRGDGTGRREAAEGRQWKDALPPEQKALQYLLRAEATFRQIQVAFGSSGGGGGGGGAGPRPGKPLRPRARYREEPVRDAASSRASGAISGRRDRRGAAEAGAARAAPAGARRATAQRSADPSQQRWQQEMLRREAEELQAADGNS